MSSQTIFSLVAACFGFVSAGFFAVGSAFLSQSKIVVMSRTYAGYNLATTEAMVSQSAQYTIGALLLFFAFLLQVVAALASTTIPQSPYLLLSSAWLLVSSVLVAISLPSWFLCRWLAMWRLEQVLSELRKEGN